MKTTIISLVLCVTLALGVGLTNPAQAAIIYVDLSPDVVVNATNPSYALDVDSDTTTDFNFNFGTFNVTSFLTTVTGSAVSATNPTSGPANNYFAGTYQSGNIVPIITPLTAGTLINDTNISWLDQRKNIQQLIGQDFAAFELTGTLTFIILPTPIGPYNSGLHNTKGYTGFQFEDAGGNTHYGWMEVDVGWSSIDDLTIYRYAYETQADTGIQAGAVPVPASLLLLGSGLLGLSLLGRRRKQD